MNSDTYDLVIVGASAAGISAAIYAARRNLNFKIVSGDIGGEMLNSGEIENYPGIKHTDGVELTQKFMEQLEFYKIPVEQPVLIDSVEKKGKVFHIAGKKLAEKVSWQAMTVIVATGIHPRPLLIPEEPKLKGRGLSYCTTCDGPLYKGKVVATIGGGNSALESALMMAELSPKVYLINKNPQCKGDAILIKKVEAKNNIEIIYNARTSHILGEDKVAGLEYLDIEDNAKRLDDIEGIFVHIGALPNSKMMAKDVKKTPANEIIVDKQCATNVAGLFAAGDVTDLPYKQIAIATGQGVCAALSVVSYLNAQES